MPGRDGIIQVPIMSLTTLAAFWTISFLFIITPGVDWAYAMSAGLVGRAVLPAVAGLLLGQLVATVLVAAGIGGIVSTQPLILTLLTTAGAGYLLWLGVRTILCPAIPQRNEQEGTKLKPNWLVRGALVSGLNPKVMLLFLALLPQFVDPSTTWSMSSQLLVLGLVHVATCGVVYVLVGYSAQILLAVRPSAATMLMLFSGVAMVLIGSLLLVEQIIT